MGNGLCILETAETCGNDVDMLEMAVLQPELEHKTLNESICTTRTPVHSALVKHYL